MSESGALFVEDHIGPTRFSPRSMPMRLVARVIRYMHNRYRRWFQHRNHIFVHTGPFLPVESSDVAFVAFDRFDEIPERIREAMRSYSGDRALEMDRVELDHGATMWAAMLGGEPVGMLFLRRGRCFAKWFVPLCSDDLVIFRMRTYPEFRGRGIAPLLMKQAMHAMLDPGDKAYIDCRVYNTASIRSIEKAGFVRVAALKPISRAEALGG